MREIKFRLIKNNKIVGYEKWVDRLQQWLYHYHPISGIEAWCDVILPHDTKEQYTGIRDLNGKEICEGDIIRYWHNGVGDREKSEYKTSPVFWDDGAFCIEVRPHYRPALFEIDYSFVEIIGNIHDEEEK